MIQGSLLYLWIHQSSKQQSNLQLQSTEKLRNMDESTAKLLELVLHREQDQCCTALSSSPTTAPFPIPYPFEQEDE